MGWKRAEMIPRLLERDDGRGAAGVTDVHALHVRAAAEARDEVRIEARRETPGTHRRRDEVDVRGRPAGAIERGARGGLAHLERAAPKAGLHLVDGLVGTERRGIQVEVASL